MGFENYACSDFLCCHHGKGSVYRTQSSFRLKLNLTILYLSGFQQSLLNGLKVDIMGCHKIIETVVFKMVLDDRFL